MLTSAPSYTETLSGTLILTHVNSPADVERLAAFNAQIHGDPGLEGMTRELILHHPHSRPEYWPFVEDTTTGQIVSSLCLIPWIWRIDGVELRAGEMGIVGTLPDYRHQGLIRALDRRFKRLLAEGEFHLSHIQGIPYYYRQFGYEYALPLEGGWEIGLHQVPDPAPSSAFSFRQATGADLPALMAWYEQLTAPLAFSCVRSADVWRYLLERAPLTATAGEFWIVQDAQGTPLGYWRIELGGFGTGLNVTEASAMPYDAAAAALSHIKTLAIQRNKPYMRLHPMTPDHVCINTIRQWGAADKGHYAWQIHLPDVARLLRALTPVFERRIAASPFAGLTETVTVNLYREAFELHFEAGKLRAVDAVGFKPWEGSNNVPPNVFVPLVLGYRSREELHACYPDVNVWGRGAALFDVLFPKTRSFIYTQY